MGTEGDWGKAFVYDGKGSGATRARAAKTWNALIKFGKEKLKGKRLAPARITPKEMRLYLEHRGNSICARSVQNEASHLRRAIRGAGRDLGDLSDKTNDWSSTRMKVPEASRIGGKVAADPVKWAEAKHHMPKDILAVVGLIEALGLRCKEAVMSGASLTEWRKELSGPEIKATGCYIHLHDGSKGGRPRHIFVPAERLDVVQKAVDDAKASVLANKTGFVVSEDDLEKAMKRYSNCMSRLELTGDDSGHGLRRYWAQKQFSFYRDSGLTEKESLRRLSKDLGHGDGRGRWVWNNYLMGGCA